MTDAIDKYLDTILIPQLEHLGVQSFPGAIEGVVTDIRLRLQSVLFRWHDLRTRNTLLLLGREEGAFYEPRSAPLEIRAFVVVAVRNSLLEDLGIPGASQYGSNKTNQVTRAMIWWKSRSSSKGGASQCSGFLRA